MVIPSQIEPKFYSLQIIQLHQGCIISHLKVILKIQISCENCMKIPKSTVNLNCDSNQMETKKF